MPLDSLTVSVQASVNWTAQKNIAGANPNQNASAITEAKGTLSTAVAGNVAGGLNELYFSIQSIVASGSFSLDLSTFTDILNALAVVGVRAKFIQIGLLSAAQDSVNGTSASSVTIDNTVANALSAQTHSGWFDNAAEGAAGGSKFTIPNGAWLQFGMTNASGVVVDATHKVIKLTNNDGVNAAAVKICAGVSTV